MTFWVSPGGLSDTDETSAQCIDRVYPTTCTLISDRGHWGVPTIKRQSIIGWLSSTRQYIPISTSAPLFAYHSQRFNESEELNRCFDSSQRLQLQPRVFLRDEYAVSTSYPGI